MQDGSVQTILLPSSIRYTGKINESGSECTEEDTVATVVVPMISSNKAAE